MLELSSLSKAFNGKSAVSNLSFGIKKGEVLGFLGQNGAGKSTTMRMIAGVLEPDSGDAEICGRSIISQRLEAQKLIGYLPEGAPLYNDLTPLEFLKFLAGAHGLSSETAKSSIERSVNDARISSVAKKQIGALSKGFRRRVGLAGAILHDPDVLILDEPTDGLDPIQKSAVRELIARLAPEKAILISTHTLEEVTAMCSRVVVINGGTKVADSTPEGLAASHSGGLAGAFVALANGSELETACL